MQTGFPVLAKLSSKMVTRCHAASFPTSIRQLMRADALAADALLRFARFDERTDGYNIDLDGAAEYYAASLHYVPRYPFDSLQRRFFNVVVDTFRN